MFFKARFPRGKTGSAFIIPELTDFYKNLLTALPAGHHVEYTIIADQSAQLVIQLSLGNCTAPNTIFLSDVKVEKAGKFSLVSDTIYHF